MIRGTAELPSCVSELVARVEASYLVVPEGGPVTYHAFEGDFSRERIESCAREVLAPFGPAAPVAREGELTVVVSPVETLYLGFGERRVVAGDPAHVASAIATRSPSVGSGLGPWLGRLVDDRFAGASLLDIGGLAFGVSCSAFTQQDVSDGRLEVAIACPDASTARRLLQRIRDLIHGPPRRPIVSALQRTPMRVARAEVVMTVRSEDRDVWNSFVAAMYLERFEWMRARVPAVPEAVPPAAEPEPSRRQDGMPTRAVVLETLTPIAPAVRRCIVDPGAHGVVRLRIEFDTRGEIASAVVVEPALSATQRDCIGATTAGIRLPITAPRSFSVDFPVRY